MTGELLNSGSKTVDAYWWVRKYRKPIESSVGVSENIEKIADADERSAA